MYNRIPELTLRSYGQCTPRHSVVVVCIKQKHGSESVRRSVATAFVNKSTRIWGQSGGTPDDLLVLAQHSHGLLGRGSHGSTPGKQPPAIVILLNKHRTHAAMMEVRLFFARLLT